MASKITQEKSKINTTILDEISIRFLIQVDQEDIENIERLFFILEEAHWFLIDNYKKKYVNFSEFCHLICKHNSLKIDIQDGLSKFKKYKQSIKVFGCIIFDSKLENVLVVKEDKKNFTFGFPKGKKNKDESGVECAIREAYEEIGFDVSTKIIRSVCINIFEKMNFFFVFNVSKKEKFESKLMNEISDIIWLPIHKLEERSLGKKFSIVTKSYSIWKKLYEAILNNRFKFDRSKFNEIIESKLRESK